MDETLEGGPVPMPGSEARAARILLLDTAKRVRDGSEAHRLTMAAISAIDDLLDELEPRDPRQIQIERIDEVRSEIRAEKLL